MKEGKTSPFDKGQRQPHLPKHPLLYGAIGTLLIVLLLMLKKANF